MRKTMFLVFFVILAICSCRPVLAAGDHLVINEVSIDSKTGTGGSEDDWVELFNPTSQPISLAGWSIQKTSATGGTLNRQALTGIVPANGYFLIVRDNASTSSELRGLADLLVGDAFSLSSNNIVYLVNANANISGANDPAIVDLVGFGTASIYEGVAAAPNILETQSLVRQPEGVDTNENSLDFQIKTIPTPQNSSNQLTIGLGGTVVLTINPDIVPVQNIAANSADIVFHTNATGLVNVNYGLTGAYGSSTILEGMLANTNKTISLLGLDCGQTYHYSIYAQNSDATEIDESNDATFTTMPCGLLLDSLTMTKQAAKANNNYIDGWTWEFNITIWNMNETNLKMKFNQWSGVGLLEAGGNMQYSADDGTTWANIDTSGSYSASGLSLNGLDRSLSSGRQIKIVVRMKVPVGSLAGYYVSNYGILTQ